MKYCKTWKYNQTQKVPVHLYHKSGTLTFFKARSHVHFCYQSLQANASKHGVRHGAQKQTGDIVYVLLLLQYSKAKAFSTSFQLLLPSEKGWGNVLLKLLNWQKWPQFTFKMKFLALGRADVPETRMQVLLTNWTRNDDGFNFSFLNAVPSNTKHSVLSMPFFFGKVKIRQLCWIFDSVF